MPARSLVQTWEKRFATMRRERGKELFLQRVVRVDQHHGDEVHAVVDDDVEQYSTYVIATGDRLETDCDCLGPPCCEHAFAVLLTLDQQQQPADRAMDAAAMAAHDIVTRPRAVAPAPPPAPAPAVQDWRRRWPQIERGSHGERVRPLATPLAFVVDLEATRARAQLVVHPVEFATRNGQASLTRLPELVVDALPAAARNLALAVLADQVPRSRTLPSPFLVGAAMSPLVVPLLFAAGRMFAIDSVTNPKAPAQDLALAGGAPFVLHVATTTTANATTVRGSLRRDGETIGHPEVAAVIPGFAVLPRRLVPIAATHGLGLLQALLLDGPLHAPRCDEIELVGKVLDIVVGDAGIATDLAVVEAPEPAGMVMVQLARALPRHVPCELRFDYGGTDCEFEAPALLPPLADGVWRRRHQHGERKVIDRFVDAGGEDLDTTEMPGCFLIARARLDATLTRLVAAGLRVQADGKQMVRSTGTRVSVRSDRDWFDVDGAIEFDGQQSVPLTTALAAMQRGERVVTLGDGRTGVLPAEWLQSWSTALDLGEGRRDGVRLQRSQAALLDALLQTHAPASVTTDDGYRAFRQRLAQFEGIQERQEPKGFQGTLRHYQRQGLGWLHFLRQLHLGGCLADDMGLGKTVQVLALLQEVHRGGVVPASLLVVPRSLLDNWRREAARFTPTLRVLEFTGGDRWQKRPAGRFDGIDLVITTYGTLRQDAARMHTDEIDFEYAILDEAQVIENEQSLTSKAVRVLRARHRLALTGTPVQNHLGELWALFQFLSPGLLGKSTAFRQLVAQGARTGGDVDHRLLHRTLAPFLLRRTKEQVLPELPEKQEQQLLCDLDGDQRRTYDGLKRHYQERLLRGGKELGNDERFVALEALLRLRQAACHPALIDETLAGQGSAKLDALLPMLKEIADSGHKALVFSQFTGFLAIVRERLDAEKLTYEYLDGQTQKRQQKVDRFQNDPDVPFFLISLKAGGTGLNLTAADYVFVLDPWWNPAAEAQAIDRAHRLGQTRKVVAYRLIARDTVEEKVLALQDEKRELVAAVLGADKSLLGRLTRDDLAKLLA